MNTLENKAETFARFEAAAIVAPVAGNDLIEIARRALSDKYELIEALQHAGNYLYSLGADVNDIDLILQKVSAV